ncbi:MAG: hypothetical protein M1812_001109 [Candelaria pacifica]|nr:MAG: hypothetical protein M1812_001109 [Candelaria pacifica]
MSVRVTPQSPVFQRRAEFIKSNPDHLLHHYYSGATHKNIERVFRCECVCKLRRYEEDRASSYAVERAFFADICPELRDNYVIYGLIGRGSFGTIVAAHSIRPSPAGVTEHFAIKIQSYKASEPDFTDVAFRKNFDRRQHTHKEAFVLSFLTGCERITQVHSAGIHNDYAFIVMNIFSVDLKGDIATDYRDLDNAPGVNKLPSEPDFQAFNGEHCTAGIDPRLDELQSRKVCTHLLEALMYINDRGIVHLDMSQRNFLIDSDLNAQLIDFGDSKLCVEPSDFFPIEATTLYALESMVSPEFLAEINKSILANDKPPETRQWQKDYPNPKFSVMDEQLWRFACIVFELLHGYAPFADLERLNRQYPVNFRPPLPQLSSNDSEYRLSREELNMESNDLLIEQRNRRYRRQRRDRIMNHPLKIQENIIVKSGELANSGSDTEDQEFSSVDQQLTQDAIDVLEAMFRKDRGTRPTLEELVTFPWFQGAYLDSGYDFYRPPRAGQTWRKGRPDDMKLRPTDSPPTWKMQTVHDRLEAPTVSPLTPSL